MQEIEQAFSENFLQWYHQYTHSLVVNQMLELNTENLFYVLFPAEKPPQYERDNTFSAAIQL